MPNSIKPFLPIIESRNIGNYFFGGGTPSLMKPETMISIFNLFPDFKAVKSKTFEIHPAIYSDEQLDVLAEYGFNCCIIGIQSFDKSVLLRQNRMHATYEEILNLILKIKDRGMYVAGDIIYKMDIIDADKIFKQDLACLESMNLDVISLQNNYDLNSSKEVVENFLNIIEDSRIPEFYNWEYGINNLKIPTIKKSLI